ncbi:MAG: hypothetical protein ABWX59_03650, partial [Microbacteriaceae bacterium]
MSFRSLRRISIAAAAVAALALTGCAGGAQDTPAEASGEGISVALSNGFVNGWRLTLINKFEEEAQKLKDEGVVSEFTTVNAPG